MNVLRQNDIGDKSSAMIAAKSINPGRINTVLRNLDRMLEGITHSGVMALIRAPR